MVIEMTLGASAGIAALPGYAAASWRLRRLLAGAAAADAYRGRHRRPGSPEPGQEPSRQEAGQAQGLSEPEINMHELSIRNAHARQVVAGFAATMPSLDGLWRQVDCALADVPVLCAVIARLTAELAAARDGLRALPQAPEAGACDDV